MTRTRKPVGRIAFVGAGPGDPGLLTRRAHDALVDADQVISDRGVPESLLAVVRAEAREDAEFTPAEGAPGDVAKVLISAARSGLNAGTARRSCWSISSSPDPVGTGGRSGASGMLSPDPRSAGCCSAGMQSKMPPYSSMKLCDASTPW